ncbi:TPA: SDR family oxidoreductase [Burkholderia cepacia ATCC 25416]|uniref:SDR family oxidoreductase n=1 Tax=Burkholderia TaxID=32008 RepID=UPI001CF2C4FA|nr:SDR family oxidoreductase [Burkholderia cepacia]HDR9767618.1 SDR family oxidoreductase [Burkholderia cepacia ATCC 25416]MCA8080409.1 SDR family oxidoreductase [Burkholderia cepacia]HDR9774820.1 SDR family oxidoreductase [Burkholderia cepacia ATCC 25416]HDR9782131.1 SDR family oxidoreductase [Burkholderia cepacia ATCC 25416]HDR9788487.1 SDR family oxidoreductase [Burkholderia cepacia ATCC 25416]
MKLDDQKVLVVGGSSGIGEATARAFAEAGATVTIASRDAARLAASKDRIGYGVSTGVMDITDDASVRAFLDSAGEFDHVVVSAAQTATGPVRGLALDDAYAAMDSKFWGAYRIARAVRIRQGGSLTFVSGFLSVRPSKNSVLQGAINAALESLARGLALELAPVRVNTVSPGLIATPLWSKIDAEARDRMYEGAAARLPAGRVGQPEDVANAVLYLASTPYATGSTVLVDGGGAIA